MIVKSKTHRGLVFGFVTLAIIGILLMLRMAFVMGVSTYMNAEALKADNKHEVTAGYYLLQAFSGDFMEPYVAYYNAGTSMAKANEPNAAERLLDTALSKVDNDYNECYIRNNLAKVQEQLGDGYMLADMASTAETYYNKSVTTIQESPMVCFPPPPSGGGEGEGDSESEPQEGEEDNPLTPQDQKPEDSENGENMKETEERSKEKEQDAKDAQGDSSNGKDQVEQEMDQSKSEMDNKSDTEGQEQNKPQNQVDKPW